MTDRWVWSEKLECMVANISSIHVIPVGDSDRDLHLATADCWCSPTLDRKEGDSLNVYIHNALTGPDHKGWVLIGEK